MCAEQAPSDQRGLSSRSPFLLPFCLLSYVAISMVTDGTALASVITTINNNNDHHNNNTNQIE